MMRTRDAMGKRAIPRLLEAEPREGCRLRLRYDDGAAPSSAASRGPLPSSEKRVQRLRPDWNARLRRKASMSKE